MTTAARRIETDGLCRLIATLLAASLVAAAIPATGQESGKIDEKYLAQFEARENEAFVIGVQAYIYGKPVVEMVKTRFAMALNPESPEYTPLNHFRHFRRLIGPDFTAVVTPNNDTLYSIAWLDLTREPVILHVPDTAGRYYTMQMMDFYTNNFAYVGKRVTGTAEGDFAIVGPGFRKDLPSGMHKIEAPTPYVWIIGRTLVNGEKDLPAVHAIQDQYVLTPLSRRGKTGAAARDAFTPKLPRYDDSRPLAFFRMMNAGIRQNPPPSNEAVWMHLFDRINVGPSQEFVIDQLDLATASGLRRAITVGQQIVMAKSADLGTKVNGWDMLPPNTGNYGQAYTLRAAIAQKGLGANSPEEAYYPMANIDGQGRSLDGTNRYVLRFEKGRQPPVDAFWSLTLYRLPEYSLVANPIDRYSIGDRTKGLQFGRDGSLEIYLQHEATDKDRQSNWLPAPKGPFYVVLRMYMPKEQVLDGTYKVPPIKRAR